MREILIRQLLFTYKNFVKSNFLRNRIKYLMGSKKIVILFNKFKINSGIKSAIEANIFFDTYNEVEVLKLIVKYSSLNYHFFDVGANIGIHSLTAAATNSKITVYSFEPEINNYNCFLKNIILNEFDNIIPFRMGIGSIVSIVYLNINEGWNKGKHSMKVNFVGSNKKVSIPITQLDSFRNYVDSQYLLLKIDVEGFEKEVLDGAKLLLNQIENIVVIIELISEINSIQTCNEIFVLLKSFNFNKAFKIENDKNIIEVSNFDCSGDYIFLKGNHAINSFIQK
ncbi:FkbM family methyltransferase [Flavobacterium turcicum]|uniref:FkbM family methyltransferase n=1 Tax=Flavobacterium turcicum TaxID=2764718 RepID=A0ABR7JGL5_9FLAO|nr:FkbM family methyltransferase [Flavobacterium turcicum]MBC5863645.1 FkbM family methyltransferase [Flavobacterium turcicum]NHL02405.1 FkbM family methyltransferase [Flavobacterium turcicum]